ncbi:bifunctional 3-(3-hydroxy-phenyl)propionate/3-hydroxycinnamic acid hydroxylase [Pyxidicoccus xibeiensis]|uniref:bifunctional 3-(3-hydroxy-phenyl)propionate/3-hydroxycinnamic acid hydroxylase n=1 Tax=Pyxidicoccus xibeiensis TaxID=2906759 RepID=UPI0020A703F9|nr:bifunctional 3-(3-hydroxy-phenyl)propionate/3-hydroxycinnamic acid hydroxylase [Pyxidicoccus xibeiensis]MCP3141986.1 bifunctional 3-(3-hydroxy-phenyl)propionate/3-hydroxycinnamic acid hydroxylase [Pyxidicoccus xibeiensis]
MAPESVDVIIVGCGPVGAMAANLLGQKGIRTLVVEREPAPHGQSRAISVDDEAQRIFQAAGLVGDLDPGFFPCRRLQYLDDELRSLAEVDFGRVDKPFGHSVGAFFQQPRMEAVLRKGLERFAHVEVWSGHEVESFVQDDEGVTARVKARAGEQALTVRAKYLLACDGAHSAIRRRLGLKLEGTTALEHSLAITVSTASPDPEFTAYLCGPTRRGFITRTSRDEIRFDIILPPDQDLEAARQPDFVRALIAHYLDPATVKVRSANVYSYHSRLSERWRVGRAFLLGDAAHLMPPFLGQGLCAGLRDAANLTWKLALVLGDAADASLLDTYEQERREHVSEVIRSSDAMGRVMMTGGRVLARVRNALIQLLYRMPVSGDFIRQYKVKPVMPLVQGFFARARREKKDSAQGTYFPQPRVELPDGNTALLDDVLGDGFVVLTRPGASLEAQREARSLATEIGAHWLTVSPAERTGSGRQEAVVDVEGRLGAWFTQYAADLVVLRPDRYVYGTAGGKDLGALRGSLQGRVRPLSRRGHGTVRRAG